MTKMEIMAAKQSTMFQACCSLAATEAKDSSTATKADPHDVSHSPCFSAANREPSIPYFKKKSDWERFWKASQKNCQTMVVIFTATWFQPGYDAENGMKKLAIDFKDVRFAKLDVDRLMDVARERKVEKILTFILFKRVQDEGKKDNDVTASMAKEEDKEGNKDKNGSKEDIMSKQKEKKANTGEKGNKSKKGHTILLEEVCRVHGHQENVFSDLRERFNEHGIIHD